MSLVQPVDLLALAPPTLLAAAGSGALVADLLVRRRRVLLGCAIGLLGVLAALLAVAVLAAGEPRSTFCLRRDACSYVADDFAVLLQALLLLALVALVPLLSGAMRDHRLPPGETVFLLLCSASGGLVLAAARDLITLVIGLELLSLPAFALVGLRRGDPRSAEAALKAFLLGVVSSALTLYGASLLYGLTGSLQLHEVSAGLAEAPDAALARAAVVLVVVGFCFKIAVVPFHFWAPDAYVGAPLPVAAYLAVVSKAAGLAGLLAVLLVGLAPYVATWGPLLAVLSALTMTTGNLLALRQHTVVRMLAWSSIAQAGYLLAPLALRADATSGDLDRAGEAVLGYLGFYMAMTLGAFAAASYLSRVRGALTVDAARGLVRSHPWVAAALVLCLAALAGLPPGVGGLVAKVVVIRATVEGGFGWLAVLLAANTVVALVYYLRWAVAALSQAPPPSPRPAPASARGAVLAALLAGGATAVLSVAPQLVLGAAAAASLQR